MLAVDQTNFRLDVDVRVEPQFDFLSDEYRAFYRPERATAFQAPHWLDAVHRGLAPQLNAKQHTITMRERGTGALVGVIPLVLQKSRGISMLQFADFGVCDYNAPVADRNVLSLMAADNDLLARLDNLMKHCDLVLLRKVRDDTFDVGRLLTRSTSSVGENAAYLCEVGDDLDAWRTRTLSKKFSKELDRLQRQAEREFGSYEHRAATSESEIRAAFDFLRKARKGRFEEDLLDNPLYFEFYRDHAIEFRESGEAITYVSYIAGKPVAVLFGVAGDGEFHAMLFTSDIENFGKRKPGLQIYYQVIQKRFAEGFRSLDMSLGNSGYKSDFKAEKTELRNYTRARSLAGSAVALVYHRAKPVKNFLKKYAPNVR
jgi:CelD/BcsL family acetyltransferase involved in cellulose biosynthesis